MNEADDLSGLRALQEVIDESVELMAAFVSAGNSQEIASADLMNHANNNLDELAAWRANLRAVLVRVSDPETSITH